MSEPSYNGAATIVVGGRRFDVHVQLTNRDAEMQKVERPDGRGGTIERRVSWGGVIDGLNEEDLRTLQLTTFELRLVNNGRRVQGVRTDASGHLQGVGEAPF